MPLLLSVGLFGCDSTIFNGSIVALTLLYPPPAAGMQPVLPPPVFHFEMWAQVQTDSGPEIHRLTANVGSSSTPQDFPGFSVVPAIDPNDSCLIRGLDHDDPLCFDPATDTSIPCGAQMFSQAAQIIPEDSTPELAQQGLVLQAQKVTPPTTHFNAVDSTITGEAPLPLLALVGYNADYLNDPRNMLTPINVDSAGDPTQSAIRLSACLEYRDHFNDPKNANPYFYVGNPRQYTKPLSGTLYGFLSFATAPSATMPNFPNQMFSGIQFSVPESLDTISELLVTLETNPPPATPTMTRIVYAGQRLPTAEAGRGVIELQMAFNVALSLTMPGPPTLVPAVTVGTSTVLIGSAAILTNLDEGLN